MRRQYRHQRATPTRNLPAALKYHVPFDPVLTVHHDSQAFRFKTGSTHVEVGQESAEWQDGSRLCRPEEYDFTSYLHPAGNTSISDQPPAALDDAGQPPSRTPFNAFPAARL